MPGGVHDMTRQKERACPCTTTDKPNTKILHPQYTMDSGYLQYVGVSYYAADDRGHTFPATVALRIDRTQYGELIHWLDFHLKGKDPPPALYALEMLLQHLEYLRGGRHYLYNSIYEITLWRMRCEKNLLLLTPATNTCRPWMLWRPWHILKSRMMWPPICWRSKSRLVSLPLKAVTRATLR